MPAVISKCLTFVGRGANRPAYGTIVISFKSVWSSKTKALLASLRAHAMSLAPFSFNFFNALLSHFKIAFTMWQEPCSMSRTRLHGPLACKNEPNWRWGATKLARAKASMERQPTEHLPP